jgi:hypothetical protein
LDEQWVKGNKADKWKMHRKKAGIKRKREKG